MQEEEILRVGDNISFNDIEKLLSKRKLPSEEEKIIWIFEALLGPFPRLWDVAIRDKREEASLALKIKELLEKKAHPIKVIEKIRGLSPALQGSILECYRENYPTIRWNFEWKDYVVVGVPDGITNRFVYEYKTVGSEFLLGEAMLSAMAQADLNGHFFKRKRKRVQIMVRETGEIQTFDEEVNNERALETLKRFREIEKGEAEPIPPTHWKCKRCEFRNMCKIRKRKMLPRNQMILDGYS